MMSRSKKFTRRVIAGDVKYKDKLIHKLINCLMLHGNKGVASKIVYASLEILEKKYKLQGHTIMYEIIGKLAPSVFLRRKKIASKVYNIPVPISEDMSRRIGVRWFVQAIRALDNKKDHTISQRFVTEVTSIYNAGGAALKRREHYHKVAKDNEVFMHYG